MNNDWIDGIVNSLTDVFRREISAYNGSVAEYLSSKRKDLRVPERVFFHVVESKEDDEEEYVCCVSMDEDDYIRLNTDSHYQCPYYQCGDEYKIVRHQM